MAFALWNVDNLLCDHVRGVRNFITGNLHSDKLTDPVLSISNSASPQWLLHIAGSVVTSVFQLHAWWHLLSGYGAYMNILFWHWHRSQDLGQRMVFKWHFGVLPVYDMKAMKATKTQSAGKKAKRN